MSLEELARDVRQGQDEHLDARRRLAVRNRLLDESLAHTRRRRMGGLAAIGVLATALIGVAAWSYLSPPKSLTFAVAGDPGTPDAFVSAEDAMLPLTFSDGSTVELAEGSNMRVGELSAHGASLRIEDGRADVHVIHQDDTDWEVKAGPYTVHVVGTSFSVAWDARAANFQLEMVEGRVEVEGPRGFRAVLEGTEVLERQDDLGEGTAANADHGDVESAPPDEESDDSALGTTEASLETPELAVAEPDAPSVSPTRRVQRPASPWRELAARGEYENACDALDAPRLRAVVRHGSADVLEEAANTLHRAQDPRARTVWMALRERFGSSAQSASAAFHLARGAFARGQLNACEHWLETYLREAPHGHWEMQSRGRLMEVQHTLQRPGLEDTARAYLERFPDGPHAHFARSLLRP